ncbi:MAG: B12-binding domain-containing radical SAM protein [Bacteroidetes bacterium]|nr:B12-binding domain-containing radical SAM protein [Bacteroidota bacterium]
MAKILFTHSYFYRFDPKQWKTGQPYPPLGTIYAAAWMRSQGHEVALFDTNLEEGPEGLQNYLNEFDPDFLVIYDDGFNYLTKMCLTNMREAAFVMARMGKTQGAKVLVCSSDSTDHYQKYLEEGADVVILGEGELTLAEFVENEETHPGEWANIQGLAFRNGEGEFIQTSKRPGMRELDSLPDPAWDLIDIEPYREIWLKHHGRFALNIATTRGCPFKCNWCAKPIYGNRYNSRSPERVVNEIEFLVNQFGVDYFWMCDDIFGLKPGWAQEFRDLVKEKGLQFKYKIQSRVDLLLKEDTIEALVDSGLETVWVGAESGSQKILDAMDKGTQVEQIYEATRLLKQKGARVAFFLQFGYLGETKEDIQKTVDMVLELMPDEIGISVSYPLPGTKFYEKVKSHLGLKANWTDSDELAMMFQGTFTTGYYKRLHRYVHKVYRRKQGWNALKDTFFKPGAATKSHLRAVLSLLYYVPTALIDQVKLSRLENIQPQKI